MKSFRRTHRPDADVAGAVYNHKAGSGACFKRHKISINADAIRDASGASRKEADISTCLIGRKQTHLIIPRSLRDMKAALRVRRPDADVAACWIQYYVAHGSDLEPPWNTRGCSVYNEKMASSRECGGNHTQAAKRLGVHRPSLIRLMKRLGIESGEA